MALSPDERALKPARSELRIFDEESMLPRVEGLCHSMSAMNRVPANARIR